jgi:hypothetical protein
MSRPSHAVRFYHPKNIGWGITAQPGIITQKYMRNVNHKLRNLLKNYDTSTVILPAFTDAYFTHLFSQFHKSWIPMKVKYEEIIATKTEWTVLYLMLLLPCCWKSNFSGMSGKNLSRIRDDSELCLLFLHTTHANTFLSDTKDSRPNVSTDMWNSSNKSDRAPLKHKIGLLLLLDSALQFHWIQKMKSTFLY